MLYVVVVAAVAVAGVVIIVDWARRGDELPGGGVPVTGRVIEERAGFTGALAIVEVAYQAGGKERRARLPVPGSDQRPDVKTFEPGDPIALVVSRSNPDRVQQAGWNSGARRGPAPSGWLIGLGAAGLLAPILLPGPRRRLQAALPGALKTGTGGGGGPPPPPPHPTTAGGGGV
jgi:hypothetical protein